ncbi:hypothetical protein [Butyrivibrio sp. LC3010]|uniref:hypothetical protein n=1 Tax=Butyrivibrio sp. LC3010 TaxID=1280680 RepID=UPI0003F71309|nr:hypothetical protein [Butyrivibrio sp. LC3010]
MGFFSHGNKSDDIDYDRLRRDLADEYGAQSAAFSGGFGFLEMCDAEDATNEQLLEMARREGFNLNKYKR